MRKSAAKLLGIFLTAFGFLTLFLTASIIFDLGSMREREGNYVLFIVWANFICGFIYVLAGIGFIQNKLWTTKLLIVATLILVGGFIGLMIHIYTGGIYEIKTVGAMLFRIVITILFVILSNRNISQKVI